jgi:Protein of unknown function (DUF4058)
MSSPFPGMDPYIEASGMWEDFHGSLLGLMRADLNAHLPEGYTASIELLVWAGDARSRRTSKIGEPDVHVRKDGWTEERETATATLSAPATIVLPRLARRKRKFLKVVDIRTRQVVTVIEVLNPTNKKSGVERAHYLEKRNEYLANNLGFVEIDLLRGGRRPPLGREHPEVSDFYVMVCRPWEFPQAGFWTFGLRDPLPDIPVPVTQELGDTPLDLGSCVKRAYDQGRYASSLSYDEPLKPRLQAEDRDWVRSLLSNRSQ